MLLWTELPGLDLLMSRVATVGQKNNEVKKEPWDIGGYKDVNNVNNGNGTKDPC